MRLLGLVRKNRGRLVATAVARALADDPVGSFRTSPECCLRSRCRCRCGNDRTAARRCRDRAVVGRVAFALGTQNVRVGLGADELSRVAAFGRLTVCRARRPGSQRPDARRSPPCRALENGRLGLVQWRDAPAGPGSPRPPFSVRDRVAGHAEASCAGRIDGWLGPRSRVRSVSACLVAREGSDQRITSVLSVTR